MTTLKAALKTKAKEDVPVWPFALLIAGFFIAFFYLMGASSQQSMVPSEKSDHDDESSAVTDPEDIEFTIEDESPEVGNFDYVDYPIARFAGGDVLYAAMGPADCPPAIDTVEYIDGTTLVITPEHYSETTECSGNITTVVERISREDRNSIDRGNTDVIVINANIPENMLWEEPEEEHSDDRHVH